MKLWKFYLLFYSMFFGIQLDFEQQKIYYSFPLANVITLPIFLFKKRKKYYTNNFLASNCFLKANLWNPGTLCVLLTVNILHSISDKMAYYANILWGEYVFRKNNRNKIILFYENKYILQYICSKRNWSRFCFGSAENNSLKKNYIRIAKNVFSTITPYNIR